MIEVHIMRGIPGSGKDTFIDKNFEAPIIFSADLWYEILATKLGKTYK